MALDRNAIYDAVFGRLQSVSGSATVGRRLKHWDDVESSEMPAIFLAPGDQRADGDGPGLPSRWTVGLVAYLYVHDESDPSGLLSTMVDRIESALEDGRRGGQTVPGTLGGLVSDCRVTSVETDEGILGDRAVARVHIEAETTS
jgi:hypothetical protein